MERIASQPPNVKSTAKIQKTGAREADLVGESPLKVLDADISPEFLVQFGVFTNPNPQCALKSSPK